MYKFPSFRRRKFIIEKEAKLKVFTMKVQLFLFATFISIFLYINSIQAEQYTEFIDPHPDYPNQCYIKSLRRAFKHKEIWNYPHCSQARCSVLGSRIKVQTVTCGCCDETPPPGCKMVTDNSKVFPGCCPNVECPDDN